MKTIDLMNSIFTKGIEQWLVPLIPSKFLVDSCCLEKFCDLSLFVSRKDKIKENYLPKSQRELRCSDNRKNHVFMESSCDKGVYVLDINFMI